MRLGAELQIANMSLPAAAAYLNKLACVPPRKLLKIFLMAVSKCYQKSIKLTCLTFCIVMEWCLTCIYALRCCRLSPPMGTVLLVLK